MGRVRYCDTKLRLSGRAHVSKLVLANAGTGRCVHTIAYFRASAASSNSRHRSGRGRAPPVVVSCSDAFQGMCNCDTLQAILDWGNASELFPVSGAALLQYCW